MDRRDFMSTVGLSALAAQSGLFGLTAAMVADDAGHRGQAAGPRRLPATRGRSLLDGLAGRVLRHQGPRGRLHEDYDRRGREARRRTGGRRGASRRYARRRQTSGRVQAVAAGRPDRRGGSLCPDYWPHANKLAAEKGNLPTILFSPMGTSFTGHLQPTAKAKHCFVAATQDHGWLATGMKMLRTIWDMKNTRLCFVNGDKTADERLDVIGTTLHYIPLIRWTDELAKHEATDEVGRWPRVFQAAKNTVEPKPEDVLNAAKNYFVAKRIMAAENCQGISLNCLDRFANRRIPCPPCMAGRSSGTRGSPASASAIGTPVSRMPPCSSLCGRPGFRKTLRLTPLTAR